MPVLTSGARHLRSGPRVGWGTADPAGAIAPGPAGASRLLGLPDVGTVEPGQVADLVAVPGDPLARIGLLREVCLVMKDGALHRVVPPVRVREG